MSMLAWERTGAARGHSAARVERLTDGWLAHGCEVALEGSTLACWFTVRLDADWSTRAVRVLAVSAAGDAELSLQADTSRRWTVNGVRDDRLDGCVDVDVAATPLTNTFPIQRFAALAKGEAVTTPVAWVDVPSLEVTRVDQTYERLEPRAGLHAWRYSDPLHGAFRLDVDDDGLVVTYEGFARRVEP
jgi:hypothetical protein